MVARCVCRARLGLVGVVRSSPGGCERLSRECCSPGCRLPRRPHRRVVLVVPSCVPKPHRHSSRPQPRTVERRASSPPVSALLASARGSRRPPAVERHRHPDGPLASRPGCRSAGTIHTEVPEQREPRRHQAEFECTIGQRLDSSTEIAMPAMNRARYTAAVSDRTQPSGSWADEELSE
jgi:hypothetical protein